MNFENLKGEKLNFQKEGRTTGFTLSTKEPLFVSIY